jgi:hypothetical protein
MPIDLELLKIFEIKVFYFPTSDGQIRIKGSILADPFIRFWSSEVVHLEMTIDVQQARWSCERINLINCFKVPKPSLTKKISLT